MPEIGQYASARFSHFECTDARFSGRAALSGTSDLSGQMVEEYRKPERSSLS